jgi:DNA-binding MarR family transcriptional regulator
MKKLKIEKFFKESATISIITSGLRLQKQINAALTSFDLNLNQSLILLAIFFEPDKLIRSNELVNIIPTTKGNISHCTSYLEEKKFISRKNVDGDLRGFEFSLTAKGQKLCLSLIKFYDKIEADCDSKFTANKLREFIELTRLI